MRICAIIVLTVLSATIAHNVKSEERDHSKYTGQQTREIKSLSAGDIEQLRRGDGWGLAKSAELNGLPGPAHLLELREQILLSPEQVGAIKEIHSVMKERAVDYGQKLISLEKALDGDFTSGDLTTKVLKDRLAQIATVRRELRFTHLAAHLKTRPLLSNAQVAQYNKLRGYAGRDCSAVPAGHDPDMWKKHNGCE